MDVDNHDHVLSSPVSAIAEDVNPRSTDDCSHITHVRKSRHYRFVNRIPAAPKKVIRKSNWLAKLDSMTVAKLRLTKCCKALKCFRHVEYDQFIETSRFTLSSSTAIRRNILTSYRTSRGTFEFDGKPVCALFLKKAFRFSTELIAAVRSGECTKQKPRRSTPSIKSLQVESRTTSSKESMNGSA